MARPTSRLRRRRARTCTSGIVALAALAILAGCGGDDETSVQEIVADPEAHYGETVTVESTVSNPIDHRVWEMADGRLFVIRDESVDPAPSRGEAFRVTGTVRPLERATIEGELGINIEDHFYTDQFLADDVVIVVDSLTRVG